GKMQIKFAFAPGLFVSLHEMQSARPEGFALFPAYAATVRRKPGRGVFVGMKPFGIYGFLPARRRTGGLSFRCI
uniref:hypothetical protein n=1 Tax=Alistipes putredinis TaxID=28117 RepID=UPI003FD70EA0